MQNKRFIMKRGVLEHNMKISMRMLQVNLIISTG